MPNSRKVGRPKSDKPYRQNMIRVAKVEDMLERILNQLHTNSSLRKLVKDELDELRIRETEKTKRKSINVG